MDRRSFMTTAAAVAATGGETMAAGDGKAGKAAAAGATEAAATPPAATAGGGAGFGPNWTGTRALAGGKGYADCPMGQVHYRSVGAGEATPFLLIHQTPVGLAEFIDIQPALARVGRRSIAADNPGHGYSDPLREGATVADLADNLAALLERLGVARAVVVGHHTGAAIAASFAARHAARTAALVLHGTPFYSPEERASRLARLAAAPGITLKPDGSHFADVFLSTGSHAGIDVQSLASLTWSAIGSLLAGPGSPIYRAVFSNDMQPTLAAIRAPTLVLTDLKDVLHANDRRVLEVRPDFVLREFSAGTSYTLMREPERWAGTVLEFAVSKGV
jgi:pimeloyl-ACP methyl ester carboxylesterase